MIDGNRWSMSMSISILMYLNVFMVMFRISAETNLIISIPVQCWLVLAAYQYPVRGLGRMINNRTTLSYTFLPRSIDRWYVFSRAWDLVECINNPSKRKDLTNVFEEQ